MNQEVFAALAAALEKGEPVRIGHETAISTRGQVGNEIAGWFQFQPLWNRITREQPDLFD